MAYYDRIAKRWHAVTGSQGGALKKLLLNEMTLNEFSGLAGRAVLELGAGNGYFIPLLLRRFSGQVPSRLVITDQSRVLLALAQRSFRVPDAEYRALDVRSTFPFAEQTFDFIVANMVFNELTTAGLRRALTECARVLTAAGSLLATVTHPAFVQSLALRGQLKALSKGVFTMPSSSGLRLPVVLRTLDEYRTAFEEAGFQFQSEDICPTAQVLSAKPGLREAGGVPVALFCACAKGRIHSEAT